MLAHKKFDGTPRGRPKTIKQESLTRCQVTFPSTLLAEVKAFGESEHITIIEAIRRLIKYGLLIVNILRDPKAKLIIREGNSERELMLV